jgi:hypothetical protein
MEPNQNRSWELRAVSVFLAVIIALMGFSAALATKPQAEGTPATEMPDTSAYQDASLAGLAVVPSDGDAPADGNVQIYY